MGRNLSKLSIIIEGNIMLPTHRAPTHPGEVLLEEFLKPLGISQGHLIEHLGKTWTQPKLSSIINKKRRVTESIALDFADAFGTTAEFWLSLQYRYDLWIARQNHKSIRALPAVRKMDSGIGKKNS